MVKRWTRPHPFSHFPRHFEVRWLNGQILDLEHYSCRIYSTTDIAWVFEAVHSVVVWPRTYISLVIGNTHFQYTSGPCKEELYLKNLYYTGVLEGTLRMTENHRFLISAIRHAPPCDFLPSGLSSRSIGCICDFPGHGCVAPILLSPVFLLCKVDGGTIGDAGGVEKVVVVVVLTVATHAVILCSNMESS